MKLRVSIESPIKSEIEWVWEIFAEYIGFTFDYVAEQADIKISEAGLSDIQLSHFFRNTYSHGDYQFKSYFRKEPLHFSSTGKPDYLSTCFYLINCLQEIDCDYEDTYARFPYDVSLQHYYTCAKKNLVAQYFDALYENTPALKLHVTKKSQPTQFYLTHDIDSVYGAYRENRKYLFKKAKIGDILKLLFNQYLSSPDWMLLDKIMKIESEYDVRSTFFWLVNKGMSKSRIMNADYDIQEKNIQKLLSAIEKNGFENGLHKSTFTKTYGDELKKEKRLLPVNRNHYLKIQLPDTFNALEKNAIAIDSSLGFAETYGFRNSYGLPFQPYHIKEKRKYNFIEAPLTIMDTTLNNYMHLTPQHAEKEILDFLSDNNTNALVTILWHNNYFFGHVYDGWLHVYKAILAYIKDTHSTCVTSKELMDKFSHSIQNR